MVNENLPQRKNNRLYGYDYSSAGTYFITICVKNKKCILGSIVGSDAHIAPHTHLSQYGLIVKKYIDRIPQVEKYVIMPNHIHMLISLNGTMWASSPTISSLIKSFKILTTKELGFSVFQRSFHDHIIRNEHDYEEIWEYIENNPKKWKEDKLFV